GYMFSTPSPQYKFYLGVETNGAGGVSLFGGRGLADDVMSTNLGIAFGSTLTTVQPNVYPFPMPSMTPPPDDGNENDGRTGRPELVNANVTPVRHFQGALPYLGPPQ
ncbi:MAG TPA: hypothetical protein VGD50_04055, partial [Candidatus Baltobacteraceae bacterium]